MRLPTRRFADAVVVSPAGRLDHASAGALRTALMPVVEGCAAGGDRVVIDLSRVEHMSSAALAVLVRARQQAGAQAGTLVVAALTPVVSETFEIGRVPAVLHVFGTVREALASISPAAGAAFDDGASR